MTDSATNLNLLIQLDDLCEQYEREFKLGHSPQLSDYLQRVGEQTRPQLLVALVSLDVALRSSEYKRMLVDQILHLYTTQIKDLKSVDTLRSVIERAIASSSQAADGELPKPVSDDSTGHDFNVDADTTQAYEPAFATTDPQHPQIAGYRIEDKLGQGGMGVVYKATQVALNRTVALKMILSSQTVSEEHLRRFEREAKAIAELKDPRFVQIYDLGYHRNQPYMALEYVEGGSLESFRRNEPQSETFSAQILETVASAMSQAHSIGLVHRDLKPHNILLTTDLKPKVADFGLVKRQQANDSEQTEAGLVMGTACYMSPEQSLGESNVGPATDIHALGGILYCLLTGRPPYLGKTRHDTILQLRNEEPVPPSRLRAGLSKDLETICLKCLEKDPRKRYASAAEVAEECRRVLTGRPISARPISSLERSWRWSKRNPLGATVALLVAAVALVSSGMTWRLNVLNTRVSSELAARKTAEGKRDAAEVALVELFEKSMEGYYGFIVNTDNELKNKLDLLQVRKRLLVNAKKRIEELPKIKVEVPLLYRTFAIANQRIGDIAMLAGGVDIAKERYDDSYDLLQRAAALEPASSVGLKNLGTICELQSKALHELGKTQKAYDKGLEALEHAKKWLALQANEPIQQPFALQAIEEYQIVLGELGLILGSVSQAGQHFFAARQAVEDIGEGYSGDKSLEGWIENEQARLDLYSGEFYRRTNQFDQAESSYRQALDRFKKLRQKNPQSKNFILAIVQTHKTAGDFLLAHRKDFQLAADQYRDAFTLSSALSRKLPDDLGVLRAEANVNYRWGTLLQLAKDQGTKIVDVPNNYTAEEFLRKSANARKLESDKDPTNMQLKMELAIALARRGDRADRADAAKLADSMVQQGSTNPRLLFQACCTYAQCSRSTVAAEQQMYREQALATLGQLQQAGWTDLVTLRSDPDLIPLQELEEFQSRLKTWDKPSPQ